MPEYSGFPLPPRGSWSHAQVVEEERAARAHAAQMARSAANNTLDTLHRAGVDVLDAVGVDGVFADQFGVAPYAVAVRTAATLDADAMVRHAGATYGFSDLDITLPRLIGAIVRRADLAAMRDLTATAWSASGPGKRDRALDRLEAARHLVLDYAAALAPAATAVPAAPLEPKVTARIGQLHALLDALAQTADPGRVTELRALVTAQLARHYRLSLEASAAIRTLSDKPNALRAALAAVNEHERQAQSDLGLLGMHIDGILAPFNTGTDAIVAHVVNIASRPMPVPSVYVGSVVEEKDGHVTVQMAPGVAARHGAARALKALVRGNPSAVAALNRELPSGYRFDDVELTQANAGGSRELRISVKLAAA